MGLLERHLGASARFASGYYVFNVLLLATYPAIRALAVARKSTLPTVTPSSLRDGLEELRGWERNAAGVVCMYALTKLYRFSTADAFLSKLFTLAKGAMLMVCWQLDASAVAWCALACAAIFVAFPQPEYGGPSRVEDLTPGSFQTLVVDGKADVGWVVTFYAGWADSCRQVEPLIAQMSTKYTTKELRFAKLDVGRWPHLATRHNVSVSVTSKQLPTIALFQGGEELGRVPHVFEGGKVGKPRFTLKHLAACFELDRRLARAKARAASKGDKEKGDAGKSAHDKKTE